MNTGAIKTADRFFRFGSPGMADILCLVDGKAIWLEVKAPNGKQSENQKWFEANVVAAGCQYHVVRSIDDIKEVL